MSARTAAPWLLAATMLMASGAAFAAADLPAGPSTRATLVRGAGETLGAFDGVDDVDWYRVVAGRGETLAAYVKAGGDNVYDVRFVDRTGKQVGTGAGGDGYHSGGAEFRAPSGGVYYLVVSVAKMDFDASRPAYAVSVSNDCLGDPGTDCVLLPNKTQARSLASSEDVDFYRIDVVAGHSYTVQAKFAFDDSPVLDLVDKFGAVLKTGLAVYGPGVTSTVQGFVPPASGAVFARVRSAGDLQGKYTIVQKSP